MVLLVNLLTNLMMPINWLLAERVQLKLKLMPYSRMMNVKKRYRVHLYRLENQYPEPMPKSYIGLGYVDVVPDHSGVIQYSTWQHRNA